MRSIVLSGFLCALAAGSAPAQIIVQGGGTPTGIPDGASIWYGTSAPANAVGTDGDFYLNTVTYCLYGPKAAGAWPSACASSDRQLGYVAESVANKGAAGGYAPLDANGYVPAPNLPPVTAINGTSVPANAAADQTVVTTAPSTGAWTALPSCPDTGGNHLNYSAVAHAFLCGNTGGTSGSVDFGGVGDGINANALLVSGSLDYSGGGRINANQLGGVSLAGLPTGLLKNTTGTGVPEIAAAADVASTLGFTPENTASRNAPNGYAPLNADGLLPAANLPAAAVTTAALNNATLSASLAGLATTGDVSAGGNLNVAGNVFANSTSAAAGCLHLSDANGAHDMGICAPSSGFNGLVNLMPTAGAAGQAITSDGADNLAWDNVANSVFGRTGAVTAQSGDYSFSQITGTVAGAQLPNNTFMTMFSGSFGGGTVGAGTTSYGGMGQSTLSATESARSMFVPFACTLRNFHIITTGAQPSGAGGTLVIAVRVAGASTSIAVTVNPGDAAQGYNDAVHTAAIGANQSFDLQLVNNNSSASASLGTWSIACMPN